VSVAHVLEQLAVAFNCNVVGAAADLSLCAVDAQRQGAGDGAGALTSAQGCCKAVIHLMQNTPFESIQHWKTTPVNQITSKRAQNFSSDQRTGHHK
jgi:hypothetical protein